MRVASKSSLEITGTQDVGGVISRRPRQDGQSPSQIGHLESISGRLTTSNASQVTKSVAGASQDGGVSKWTIEGPSHIGGCC
eukprot:4033286-Prymnesium_polylepis.1